MSKKIRAFIGYLKVLVNGESCTMRGRKIRPGDTVTLGDVRLSVT